MRELTFDQAVDMVRERIYSGHQDQEYVDAVNTLVYLWDQERVNEINKAVLLEWRYKDVPEGELYLIFKVQPLTYMHIRRDKTVRLRH